MASSSGRRGESGAPKQWRTRLYCCHGKCTSNTADFDPGVKMLPFPKPCAIYLKTIYDNNVKHYTKNCPQCTKAKNWMHLCQCAYKKLQKLSDIDTKTYICSKHFVDSSGPTELYPDPFSADTDLETVEEFRSNYRKRPAAKRTSPKPEQRNVQESSQAKPQSQHSSDHEDLNNIKFETVCVKEELMISDHEFDNQSITSSVSEDFLSYAAQYLVLKKWDVRFDVETIRVTIDKVHVLINRKNEIFFEVYGHKVSGNSYLSRAFPSNFDPTQDNCIDSLIEILETVKQQWQVCKCHIMSEIAREYDELQINPGNDHDHYSLSSACCHVLTKKKICDNCKLMLRCRARRLRNRPLLMNRMNLRYITRSEAVDCVRDTRKKLRLEKRKMSRLKIKLVQLIDSRGTQLAGTDSASLLDILTSIIDRSNSK